MRLVMFAAMVMSLLVMGACQTTGGDAEELASSLDLPDTTAIEQSGELRIGPLDMLTIGVFGVPELGGDYQVDFQGRVKMPLAGEVRATGLTSFELADVLERRLGEKYLQDPDVSVLVKKTQQDVVTVEGSVNRPGQYPIRGKLSLLQAIALSGGTDDTADLRRVVVFRQIQGERQAAGFDLKAIRNGDLEDPEIFGNDIIVVDGSQLRQNYRDLMTGIPLLGLFLAL